MGKGNQIKTFFTKKFKAVHIGADKGGSKYMPSRPIIFCRQKFDRASLLFKPVFGNKLYDN